MTVKELRATLATYADDQYVAVLLHTDTYPDGCQVFLQGVRPYEGMKAAYYPADAPLPLLVGLLAHDQNKEI